MQLRRDERLLNYLYLRLQLYAHYVLMQKKLTHTNVGRYNSGIRMLPFVLTNIRLLIVISPMGYLESSQLGSSVA